MSYQTNKITVKQNSCATVGDIIIGQLFQFAGATTDDNIYMKIASGPHNAVNLKFGNVFALEKDKLVRLIPGVTIG